jgi:hypothetical protein
MVLHHGGRGWRVPTGLHQLLDLDDRSFALLRPHIPTFELLLDDISEQDDEELLARATTHFARLTLLCLKALPNSPQPLADLRRWFDLCAAVIRAPGGAAAFFALARYILATTEIERNELWSFARELGPKAEEVLMTGEQRLIAQGEAKGRAEGEAKGRAEGEAKVLLKLLASKFGDIPESIISRVRGGSVAELDVWVDRILLGETLEAVFGD